MASFQWCEVFPPHPASNKVVWIVLSVWVSASSIMCHVPGPCSNSTLTRHVVDTCHGRQECKVSIMMMVMIVTVTVLM